MISITVNGEQLDLLANTSIEFEFINPAFSTAGQDGSFGYPFTLPGTTKNHRITGHAYNLQKREVLAISMSAQVHVLGLPLAEGVLKLTYPVSREQVKVFVVVNTFADAVKNVGMRNVDYGNVDSLAIAGAAYETYMNARTTPGSDRVAFYPSLAHLRQNPYEAGSFTAFFREIVPHPYINFLYEKIIRHFGYNFTDQFFSTAADLQHLTLYHHRHVDFDPDTASFLLDIAKLVPDIDVADFVKALDSLFNTKIFVDNRRKNVTLIHLESLLDAAANDWTSRADSNYEIDPFDPDGFTLEFSWSDIDDFHEKIYEEGWKLLIEGGGYYLWENKESVSNYGGLADIDGVIPGSGHFKTVWVEDSKVFYFYKDATWNRLQWDFVAGDGDPMTLATPQENGVYFDSATQQYWCYLKYEYGNTTPIWRKFSYRKTEELIIGNGNTKVTAKAHSTELFYADFILPLPCSKIQVTGNGNDGGNQEEAGDDESVRMLIYRGLDTTSYPGISYPFATPDEYDTRGALVGTHSLRWDGPRGLYEKFWKRWLDFLSATRLVQRQLRLTAADIFNLDLTQQVRIDNINYLIGKINVRIGMNGISPARCELYTVGSGTESTMANTSGSAPAGGVGVMEIESTNIVG